MRIEFHPGARSGLNETAAFYEDRALHLGEEFLAEVQAAAERLVAHPDIGFPVTVRLRRYLIERFPYSLLYHQTEDGIFVLAVMHHRRQPGYWKDRTSP